MQKPREGELLAEEESRDQRISIGYQLQQEAEDEEHIESVLGKFLPDTVKQALTFFTCFIYFVSHYTLRCECWQMNSTGLLFVAFIEKRV
jgi:hypothetical protein